jgi:PIN domain nuclease of toxin-antitoxin system
LRLLVDTHLLLWAGNEPERLSAGARSALNDPRNELMFSAASMWEIAIKLSRRRNAFEVDIRRLRRELLDHGYAELDITSEHAFHVETLPLIHKDPFDRMLVAQALAEGLTLLTGDATIARYGGAILLV